MHSLWLTKVDDERRVNAVKGVRQALDAIGLGATGHGLRHALALTDECRKTQAPVLIGRHTNEDHLRQAADVLLRESNGSVEYDFDLSPEDVFAGGKRAEAVPTPAIQHPADAETEFSPSVYESAMVLIVAQQGSPAAALAVANTLMRTTPNVELWDDVGDCILHVFPPSTPSIIILDNDNDDEREDE